MIEIKGKYNTANIINAIGENVHIDFVMKPIYNFKAN